MPGQLGIRRWLRINVDQPVYAVSYSADGQTLAVGSERGLTVFDIEGRTLFKHHPTEIEMPTTQVAFGPESQTLYIVIQAGQLLQVEWAKLVAAPVEAFHQLLDTQGDLNSLSLSHDGALIALGHLGPALTLLSSKGDVRWRRHPDDRTSLDGNVWYASLDSQGSLVYVGSSATGTVLVFDAITGRCTAQHHEPRASVTGLATLSGGTGVAISYRDTHGSNQLRAYTSELDRKIWVRDFEEPVTALAADAEMPYIVAAVGYNGVLHLLDSVTGHSLAEPFELKSGVNGLAIHNKDLAAATKDGELARLQYYS